MQRASGRARALRVGGVARGALILGNPCVEVARLQRERERVAGERWPARWLGHGDDGSGGGDATRGGDER